MEQDIGSEIKLNVIQKIFPNLINYEVNLLLKYLLKVIDIVSYCFFTGLDKKLIYRQLTQNSYRDIIGLLYMLLPYINPDSDKKQIKTLNDIFTSKNKDVDIEQEEPKYTYSNIQYGRCNRDNRQEIEFKYEFLEHSFYLLIDTIRKMGHKLFLNWVNIVQEDQATIETRTTEYYSKGYKYVDLLDPKTDVFSQNNQKDIQEYLSVIQMDDIYDTIYNEFYAKIKNSKFLLYNIMPNRALIQILPFLFQKDTYYLLNVPYDDLTVENKSNFKKTWEHILEQTWSNSPFDEVPNSVLVRCIKSIIIFFDKYYRIDNRKDLEKYKAIKKRIRMEINEDEFDLKEEKYIFDFNEKQIRKLSEAILPEYIYDFLQENINIIKSSFFAESYIVYKSVISTYFINPKPTISTGSKHLYNFAKSLCHYIDENGKYLEFPRYWRSMNREQKQIILDRLNDKTNSTNWFNISNILRDQYRNIDIKSENDKIYNEMLSGIITLVCISLLNRGLLTKFKINLEITDNTSYQNMTEEESTNKRLSLLRKSTLYSNNTTTCRHPFTDLRINAMIMKKQEKFTGNYQDPYELDYFDKLKNMFDSDYFANIIPEDVFENLKKNYDQTKGMYIKYIDYLGSNDSRMWYYTAYAMDWISQLNFFHRYINNRVIFVTGATGVGKSTEMPKLLLYALKAYDYSSDGKIVCTQPRTKPVNDNSYIISSSLGVTITDSETNDDNFIIQKQYRGTKHTKNLNKPNLKLMTDGFLVTELKNIMLKTEINEQLTINNKYDIVIVDEAHEHNANMDMILTYMKYATYYNNSIKLVIVSATMDDDEPNYRRFYRDINDNRMWPLSASLSEHKIDRINIDRRVHISPPSIEQISATRHVITEKFVTTTDPDKFVVDLASTTTSGDILYFQPGQAEIKKTIKYLNEQLPSHIYAMPFYKDLSDEKRNFISEIKVNISKLTIDKSVDFTDPDIKDPLQVKGSGSYTRAIIVATNIAEASITIDTLKHVVDTGTQKTNFYNYKTRQDQIKVEVISESSRQQRRGRVGRVGPGWFYGLYPENNMIGRKSSFAISRTNIIDQLYEFFSANNTSIFSNNNDPNKLDSTIDLKLYSEDVANIIKYQYFLNNTPFNYFGDMNQYDYNNNKIHFDIYKTGFSKETLDDTTGIFYIIHPEEIYLERNIFGQFTALRDQIAGLTLSKNHINSEKMQSFWSYLIQNLMLINLNNTISKTQFGIDVNIFKRSIETITDSHLIITLLYGLAMECSENIIRFCAIYPNLSRRFLDAMIIRKTINGRSRIQIDSFNSVYGNTHSDVMTVLNVLNKLHKYLELLNIDIDMSKPILFDSTIEDIESYNKKRVENVITPQVLFRVDSNKLQDWCSVHNINPFFIKDYLKRYLEIQNSLYCLKNKLIKKITLDLDSFTNTIKESMILPNNMNEEDKIIVSIANGFYNNIYRNMPNTKYYMSCLDPNINYIVEVSDLIYAKDTLVSQQYLEKYILFLSLNTETESVTVINEFKPHLFKHLGRIYNNKLVREVYTPYYNAEIKGFLPEKIKLGIIGPYKQMIKSMSNDINENYDNTIWLKLANTPEFNEYAITEKENIENNHFVLSGGSRKLNKLFVHKKLINI